MQPIDSSKTSTISRAAAACRSVRPYMLQVQNVELVVIIILGCVLWNLIAFFTFAKRMFPNFWSVRRAGSWGGVRVLMDVPQLLVSDKQAGRQLGRGQGLVRAVLRLDGWLVDGGGVHRVISSH